ncbi:MAG TPA: ABC transporter permease [Gemmatimonadales bacterium]|nr:ABC transporter permease [Gemmatimonadales bacterium]
MNPARWLGWLLPDEEREFVLGDLEEAYHGHRVRFARELLLASLCIRFAGAPPAHLSPLTSHRKGSLMGTLFADLRFGFRQLAKSPGFTLLALLTLALGIGVTTAVFSVVNPVLLRALPYPEPDRIMTLWERGDEGEPSNTGYATFTDVRQLATTFDGLAALSSWQPTLQGGAEAERLDGQRVTREFFSVLGVRPALGRDFSAAENVRGQHRVVILSHGLWQRRFGGDRALIGRPITLNGIPYTVVGVMPQSFESLLAPTAQLWAPLGYDASLRWACRTCRHLRMIGRLHEDVDVARAKQELDLISARLVAEHPTEYPKTGMVMVPLQTRLTREVRPALLAVLGAVGFVLLIACANVSSLLLGRAMQRESEFAIRGALGAGRRRVVQQLLTESVVLALVGGAAGVALARGGVKGLVALAPGNLPRLQAIGIDAGVLGFTGALSVACGILFGLIPAFATARPDLFTALRPGGRHTGQKSRRVARAFLVMGEVALALMLLVGAGLLLRSLQRLLDVDPGFEPKQLLTMEVQTTGPRYEDEDVVRAFFVRTAELVRAIPGVGHAGWTSQLPLGGNFDRYGVSIEGKPLPNPANAPSADRYAVTPGYLEAMRIPLKRGRTITADDARDRPAIVLINETFARQDWPGGDALGARIQLGGPDAPWRTVVGIVGDVHHVSLDERQAPQVYVPEAQWLVADGAMILAARTREDPASAAALVREAIRSIDRDLPILHVAPMEQVVANTAEQRRFAFVLFQGFALVALLLAAAGIYGVLAGNVTARTREIGIRSALGASRGGLLRLVIRQGLALTAAGIAAGLLGALLLTRLLRGLLFGVGAQDPVTFFGVVVVLAVVALAACVAPAVRATRVSPLEALRSE